MRPSSLCRLPSVLGLALGLSACASEPPPVAKAPSPDVHPPPAVLDDPGPPPAPAPDPPSAPAPAGDPSCDARSGPLAPIIVTADQWADLHGRGAGKLSALDSSKEKPVQTCGAARSYRLVAALTCDDGSKPLPDARSASKARQGNVGPGGPCGNIIDVYRLTCPEGDHDVFVDMYWCTEAMDFDAPLDDRQGA